MSRRVRATAGVAPARLAAARTRDRPRDFSRCILARRLVSSDVPMSTARVLGADDQPDILEALRWLLSGEGYEAQFVDSTEAVLDRLGAESFDLLLMDLNYSRDTTSGREGLSLIPRVRERDPALPIVVMTGWGSID